MWNDICMSNTKNVLNALDELVKGLAVLRKSITSRDEQSLIENFNKAKSKRDGLERPA